VTTSGKENVKDFDKLKEKILLAVQNTICMDEIPGDMIVNFDQTGIHYIPVMPWTMDKEGVKHVEIVAKDDKRQIIAVFAGMLTGDFYHRRSYIRAKQLVACHSINFPLSGTLLSLN